MKKQCFDASVHKFEGAVLSDDINSWPYRGFEKLVSPTRTDRGKFSSSVLDVTLVCVGVFKAHSKTPSWVPRGKGSSINWSTIRWFNSK